MRTKKNTQPKKQMATVATGQFANMDELADFKTKQANEMLAKIKNLDEYFGRK
jgi:hypothetical protein